MEFYGVRNFEVYLTLFALFVPILGIGLTRMEKNGVLCEKYLKRVAKIKVVTGVLSR